MDIPTKEDIEEKKHKLKQRKEELKKEEFELMMERHLVHAAKYSDNDTELAVKFISPNRNWDPINILWFVNNMGDKCPQQIRDLKLFLDIYKLSSSEAIPKQTAERYKRILDKYDFSSTIETTEIICCSCEKSAETEEISLLKRAGRGYGSHSDWKLNIVEPDGMHRIKLKAMPGIEELPKKCYHMNRYGAKRLFLCDDCIDSPDIQAICSNLGIDADHIDKIRIKRFDASEIIESRDTSRDLDKIIERTIK